MVRFSKAPATGGDSYQSYGAKLSFSNHNSRPYGLMEIERNIGSELDYEDPFTSKYSTESSLKSLGLNADPEMGFLCLK